MHYGRAFVKKKIKKCSATVRPVPGRSFLRQHHDTSAIFSWTHTHKPGTRVPGQAYPRGRV